MKFRTRLLVLLLIVVASSNISAQNSNTASMHQNPNNMIRGRVRGVDGATINNAMVELYQGNGGMVAQAVTRNEGDFTFAQIPAAEYEVHVAASGFEPVTQSVKFMQTSRASFGEVVSVEITLKVKAAPTAPPVGVRFVQEVPKAARAAFEKAMEKLRDNKYEETLALLREAVTLFSDYFDANFMLARELLRAGQDQEALEALERARHVNEREGGVYHLFGLVMLKQKKFVVAELAFREAIKFSPNHAVYHLFRGKALIELAIYSKDDKRQIEDLSNAEKALNQAWELSEKKLHEVYLQRARIHVRKNEKEAAIKEFENFLKAEPNAPNAAAIRQAIDSLRADKKP
jgi:Tfp pilus assembly protein PilF